MSIEKLHEDLLIFGSSMEIVNFIKALLNKNFHMIYMGEANMILGMNITRVSEGICLDQC